MGVSMLLTEEGAQVMNLGMHPGPRWNSYCFASLLASPKTERSVEFGLPWCFGRPRRLVWRAASPADRQVAPLPRAWYEVKGHLVLRRTWTPAKNTPDDEVNHPVSCPTSWLCALPTSLKKHRTCQLVV